MGKKAYIFGSLAILAIAVMALFYWRAQIMGPGARLTAGGLAAVDPSGTPIPPPPAQEGVHSENQALQQAGDLLVRLELTPYPPRMGKTAQFKITLTDESGKPVDGAQVSLDLTMPGMYMPPNQPVFAGKGGGVYEAEAHFTMRGLWRMEAIITLGDRTQSVFFDVWL